MHSARRASGGRVTYHQAPRTTVFVESAYLPTEWAAETTCRVCHSLGNSVLQLWDGVEVAQGFRPALGSCHLVQHPTDSPSTAGQEIAKA